MICICALFFKFEWSLQLCYDISFCVSRGSYMWHNSTAPGCFPGWYWPSQGVLKELPTSLSEGGVNYCYLQVSAEFEVQQGIISRNVSRFCMSQNSVLSPCTLPYCLLYLYPWSLDYCHRFGCACSQFLCILKLSITQDFQRKLSSIMFSYAWLMYHNRGSIQQ